jgi:DNA-binding response OmpR family regulator
VVIYIKILIIEDEFNLADAIASMLSSQKYDVDIRTAGKRGFNDALTGIYDIYGWSNSIWNKQISK